MKECLLERFAIRSVVSGLSIRATELNGVVNVTSVDILGSEDLPVVWCIVARNRMFFEDEAKRVAGLRIGIEIEIEGEDLRETHCEFRMLTNREYGLEQRTL